MSSALTETQPTASAGPAAPTERAAVRFRPLPPGKVRITGGLWHERAETNRRVTLPAGERQLEAAQNLKNLRLAAGEGQGAPHGPIFADSDVHKWLEAAAWEYGRSGGEDLQESMLRLTEMLARAQAEDGYLNSVVQLREGQRYRDLPWSHEHYCAGHLIQAAVAHHRTTGRTELLEVAVRFADHLVATFGPGRTEDVDGHPVIETALVELYRQTGRRQYLDLASWFVEARGRGIIEGHGHAPTYFSDRVPVREADTVEGHAVRAVYLATGAADVAVETGDAELLEALKVQYSSMMRSKQYLTGGLGARWEGEAFGDHYELPADRAYAETCAAIGGVQWAWRMLLATGDPVYADQIELMLFNGFLAGVSLSGDEFFYVNPLQLRTGAHPEENRSPAHGRRGWFDCACCPPNVMRTFSSLEGYLATTDDAGLQVHQYAPGSLRGAGLVLTVGTEYPWRGRVAFTVQEVEPGAEPEISLRIPAWAEGATLDGDPVQAGSYAALRREWAPGDEFVLELPLSPHWVRQDPRVDAVRGCAAVMRGPLVYAFEDEDQPEGVVVDLMAADPGAQISEQWREDLFGGTLTLRLEDREQLTAIPYHLWANRGPQPMRVWVPLR